MFARLFQKPSQSESQESPSPQSDGARKSMTSSEMSPLVGVHYGIPSTASILAFDPIQRLLAVGTLDGRIKVVGGDNIEGLLKSPKAVPFKNLEFLQNQGFLASVSNENEIQVWDLVKRCIPSKVKWESNITAFSVIPGTNYMYVGDEYGFLSVLKYDAEQGDILHLPYHIPPNLIAEEAGVSMPEHQSIVSVLSQPCSCESRVLIAYKSGLIILWDVTKDKAVHVKCSKDIQLKGGTVLKFSDNQSHTSQNDSIDNEEAEKEISSLCWVSPDGSVLAVGYVDGDILLWNLSVSENGRSPTITNPLNDVVKVQLSSVDRRFPVIDLHWSPSKGQSGQLFAYGGEEIGSEKVLTILELDWSSGLSKLKCIERVDLALHGSFADVIMIPNSYKTENNAKSLFVLTNPGQLHFYEYTSLSILKHETRNGHPVHTLQYRSVIPTVEPFMTVGKLCMLNSEREMFRAPLEKVSDGGGSKWPLTGGVLFEVSPNESNNSRRIYIGGYQDGSVRIWYTTFPVLSLVYEFRFEIKDIEVAGANASVSALDFCSTNSTLAIGNENGVIFLYRLQGNSNQTTVTIVTETKNEVHNYLPEERNRCSTIYSLLSSPISSLQFATSGVRLFAGFECGQVAVLDISSPSILFVTDCVSSSQSPVISLVAQSSPETNENKTETESAKEIAFILTRDAHMATMDSTTGKITYSQLMHPEEKSIAICMHLLEMKHPLVEGSKDDSNSSSHHIEAESQSSQSNPLTESDLSETETVQSPSLDHKTLPSHILLCCEDAFYFYPMKSFIQRDSSFVHKLKLEKPCSWTTIVKRDAEKCGLVVVYQTGEIEMRSLPELQLLGKTSMISILRWNFKTNMDKTMSSSDKGQITLVNGNEFAIVSLLASDNEFRVPETLPCLHDVVLAAAANTEFNFSQNQKKVQVINSGIPGFISNVMKGLKGVKEEQEDMNYTEAREIMMGHLEKTFSRFPFSSSSNEFDIDELLLEIDDMNIEEPVPSASSSHKISPDVKGKVSEREKLFEGASTDTKPAVRTREEIIAKYRKTDDAASAASQAKEKLMERKEKLEKLSLHSEELQNGAEDFASLAKEIAKQMEKRKWWQL